MHTPEEAVVSFNKDQTQIMKGKRTKRPRLATSSLDLASPATTSSSPELRDSSREEEEDMANCLILLARGREHAGKLPSSISHPKDETYVYQCKTCDRCFPSFQALGGHRASHKKLKPALEEKLQVGHDYDAVSLQLSSRALCNNNYSSSSNSNNNKNNKSRVHECAICGAEFSSGQALGGHMRRHKNFVNAPATATTSVCESIEPKKPRNVLKLDLNLPAPEQDHHHDHTDSTFPYHSKDVNLLVFSASPLVRCHY